MTFITQNVVFLCLVVVSLLPPGVALSSNTDGLSSSSEPQQMQDFNLAGYGAKGQKTWEVEGASMDMVGNEVKISNITAHLYGDKENMVLTADKGQFDKESGVVHLQDNVQATSEAGAKLSTDSLNWSQKEQLITTDDKVNITKNNMTAVATGIEAKPDFKVAKLEKDVVLTIEQQKKTEGDGQDSSSEKNKIVVTCDGPMELNYEKNFAVFQKNVKVEGDAEQGTMLADKMTIYFSTGTKQIEKMEAQGHVKIVRGENISLSDSAVFTAADKKLVLTGKPQLVIFSQESLNVSP